MTRIQGRSKRPCRVCGRWYQPSSRQRERQRTCGERACVQEWHRRSCRRWNRRHCSLPQASYLAARLAVAETPVRTRQTPPPPARGVEQRWPREILEQRLGVANTVLVGYIARKVIRGVQDAIRS